jgi:hypothetical protein
MHAAATGWPCAVYYAPPYFVGCPPQHLVALVPVAICHPPWPCVPCREVIVPRELEVDSASSPRTGLVGGRADTRLTLEYLVDAGAAAAKIEVKLESEGTTSTWSATSLDEGYHAEEGFLSAPAGTKVSVAVTEASARLRWCERICC